jgi:phage terminase large subunit-like protein
MAAKKGRQTPTVSFVLPYKKSFGKKAADLYEKTGNHCQTWQKKMLRDLLAYNQDGLWTHTKFGYSIPRRNGKNEVVVMRELYALQNSEKVLHTAHRTTTSHSAWERLCNALDKMGVDYKSVRASGREFVQIDGGRVDFRTRSSKGGLGEGFDLLVIDEAQEYTDDQESALKYVVTDSKNPQTIFCGTPPTAVSSGTVFVKYRKKCLEGALENCAWEEWSVPTQSDPHEKKLWYETNPSLGTVFTERSINDEIGTDDIDFNIQRLGLWIAYNQKSAISEKEWHDLAADAVPKLKGKMHVGIKYGIDNQNVSMSIALKTQDNKVFIESIDCREVRAGNSWILAFLSSADIAKVVVDGASGQGRLKDDMRAAGLKAPVMPTVKEIINANSVFEQGVYAQNIVHMDQLSLSQAVSNCDKRAIGSNGGFGYKSQREDIDISLMDSAILAYWSCFNAKEGKRQKIIC